MKFVLKTFEIKNYNPKTDKSDRANIKQELYDQFHDQCTPEELKHLKFDQFKISITFYLFNDETNTKPKADLDNLLKPVLDILSEHRDNDAKEPGLGIISDDHKIYDLHASKIIVSNQKDAGITIRIQEHAPDKPQPA